MFYCGECADKYEYPKTLMKSQGRCEICDKGAICNDMPSRMLPEPKNVKANGPTRLDAIKEQSALATADAYADEIAQGGGTTYTDEDFATANERVAKARRLLEARQTVQAAERAMQEARHALWEAERDQDKCHWCGATHEDNENNGNGPLIDFRLVVSEGEEGYSNVLRYACQACFEIVTPKLESLGFYVHAHGGICFLEAMQCPGANGGECPTPEDQFGD